MKHVRPTEFTQRAGRMSAVFTTGGWLRELRRDGVQVNLFPGTELEGSPCVLVLRSHDDDGTHSTPLVGPRANACWRRRGARRWVDGDWRDLHFSVELELTDAAWCWRITLSNRGTQTQRLDLLHTLDVALAPFGAIRLNEAYVSQYIDHQPLTHATHGTVIASRQNQAVDGRTPWLLTGSLHRAVSFATDALQITTASGRDPNAWARADLPGTRLQHEHSLIAVQDQPFELAPGATTRRGFFGLLLDDHPAATSDADLHHVDAARAALAPTWRLPGTGRVLAANGGNLFARAQTLAVQTPADGALTDWFGAPRHHAERAADGKLLSFFTDDHRHVVLAAKEAAVLRPHGHLMRSGAHWTPDERGITSTAWMRGVFASGVSQGHASANTALSNQRGYLNLFRAHGQRVFVAADDGQWQLLEMPSAWEIGHRLCRWFYQGAPGLIVVSVETSLGAPEITLTIDLSDGPPRRVRIVHHVSLNGQDGLAPGPVRWHEDGDALVLRPAEGSPMHERFPEGMVHLRPLAGHPWSSVADDRVLFDDGRSRDQSYLCLDFDATRHAGVTLRCELIPATPEQAAPDDFDARTTAGLLLTPPRDDDAGRALAQIATIAPWLADNALVHYLSPRGLEQFSGGGWGTRDVSQGPTELLLAIGRHDALRDLLRRVFSAQNADGDWPQWFMFYPRDAHIRAGDSHGDIVFWPLVALAQYLIATGDATLLQDALPWHGSDAVDALEVHVARAFDVIEHRMIAGTHLVAYGHGDWNDALQPVDPAQREHLCSAWTVTLHYRLLSLLSTAWDAIGRPADATGLRDRAARVLADFQRVLIVDGELAGYASFEHAPAVEHLLHPRDAHTGIRHSALAMIHAVIDELFTPEQARAHVALIAEHLTGPDGIRLFDRPLPYTGGTQRLFQRGESASYFGREIGLMYMHAHLRWAEALAHLGDAEAFFHALRLMHPIGIESLVTSAARRQRNCYYSSSDAAFADRYQAQDHYDRIDRGDIALEGGWRVYSSGAGIAFRLILQCLLGLRRRRDRLVIDPVMPVALDGLRARLVMFDRVIEVTYHVSLPGHGVQRVALDGEALDLTRHDNRYRSGAVAVASPRLHDAATGAACRLEIWLGHVDTA